MLSPAMKKKIAVIGAGRVGQTLAQALRRRGYRIGAVARTSLRRAQAAVRFIGGGTPRGQLGPSVAEADIILIAVPDGQVVRLARQLARLPAGWKGKVVLHTSGVLSARELAPLQRLGAVVGSVHPLFPFSRPLKDLPHGIGFGVEGGRKAVREATALARAMGGRPIRVPPGQKKLYHAAAVLAAGHLMTLFDLAVRALGQAGVPTAEARRALLPLSQATLEAYARWGAQAWTGPLARGDGETVWHHLVALKRLPRPYREVYLALARAGLLLHRKSPAVASKELRRLLQG